MLRSVFSKWNVTFLVHVGTPLLQLAHDSRNPTGHWLMIVPFAGLLSSSSPSRFGGGVSKKKLKPRRPPGQSPTFPSVPAPKVQDWYKLTRFAIEPGNHPILEVDNLSHTHVGHAITSPIDLYKDTFIWKLTSWPSTQNEHHQFEVILILILILDSCWPWIAPLAQRPALPHLHLLCQFGFLTRARSVDVVLMVMHVPTWTRPWQITSLHAPHSASGAAFLEPTLPPHHAPKITGDGGMGQWDNGTMAWLKSVSIQENYVNNHPFTSIYNKCFHIQLAALRDDRVYFSLSGFCARLDHCSKLCWAWKSGICGV